MQAAGGSVLVLTNSRDVTLDVVLRRLAARRVPVVRLDPGTDLHAGASLSARYGTGEPRGVLRTTSREVDLSRIRSVWVRRPTPYRGPPGLDGQERVFAAEQSFWGYGGILGSVPGARYVNHPWNGRAAEYKVPGRGGQGIRRPSHGRRASAVRTPHRQPGPRLAEAAAPHAVHACHRAG